MKGLARPGRRLAAALLAFNAILVGLVPLSADEPDQSIADRQMKARQSIAKTVKAVKDDYGEFHEFVQQGEKAVEEAVREVEGVVSADQLSPRAKKQLDKLRADVGACRAADEKFRDRMQKMLDKAKAADALTAQDGKTTGELVALANELVQAYGNLKGEKWLSDAKRKSLGIDARAQNFRAHAARKAARGRSGGSQKK